MLALTWAAARLSAIGLQNIGLANLDKMTPLG
jgi:hypothetical protein